MRMAAGEFKSRCLKLMDHVQKHHEEIIITKRGTPAAKLVPVKEEAPEPIFGYMKSSVKICQDITGPLDEKWNAEKAYCKIISGPESSTRERLL